MATVYEYQNYTKSSEDAVADVLKAGLMIVSSIILVCCFLFAMTIDNKYVDYFS